MRINKREAMAIVRLKYPEALVGFVTPKWFQIRCEAKIIGEGPTKAKAWKSAVEGTIGRKRGLLF